MKWQIKRGRKQTRLSGMCSKKNYSYKRSKWKDNIVEVLKRKIKEIKIVSKPASFKDKQKILTKTWKVKGINLYTNEDYS